MNIPCAKEITSIKGEPLKLTEEATLKLGDVLAEALLAEQTQGKHKMYILATKAAENKDMEVDSADLSLIKKAVENCKSYGQMNTLIMGQALGVLEEVK